MSRYQLRAIGVFDCEQQIEIRPGHAQWGTYLAWLAEGNHPLPAELVRRPPPDNTVSDAKRAIRALEAAQPRLLREVILGTPQEQADARARLLEIEEAIKPHRLVLGAAMAEVKPDKTKKEK